MNSEPAAGLSLATRPAEDIGKTAGLLLVDGSPVDEFSGLPPVDVVDVLKPSGDPHQAAEDIDEGAEDGAERADGAAVDLNPGVQLLLPGAGGPGGLNFKSCLCARKVGRFGVVGVRSSDSTHPPPSCGAAPWRRLASTNMGWAVAARGRFFGAPPNAGGLGFSASPYKGGIA